MRFWLPLFCGVVAICCLSCGNKTGTGGQGNQPPQSPTIYGLGAADGSTNVPIDATLQWVCFDPDGDPLFYDVYFGVDSIPPAVRTNITVTTFTPGNMGFKTRYFWRIVAKDQFGNKTSSPTWSFTTQASDVDFTLNPIALTFAGNEVSKTLTISVANDSTLTWNLTSSQPWLSVSPTSGTTSTSSTVTVSVSRTGLATGVYHGVLAFSSNGGNDSVTVDMTVGGGPALSVSPDTLNLGSDLDALSFRIRNLGTSSLTWSIQSTASWLGASPASGTTNTETDSVAAIVNRSGMGTGNFSGLLIISSNGGSDTVVVLLNNGTGGGDPQIEVAPDTLRFAATETSKPFTIQNIGGSTLTWTASESRSWMSLSPTSGSTTTETDQVTVTVNRSGLSGTSYTGTITVISNGGRRTVVVQMAMSTTTPVLNVSPTQLDFGSAQTSLTFRVQNSGNGNLNWTLNEAAAWLSVSPTSGTTTTENDDIAVTVNREGFGAGAYSAVISVSSNGGAATVNVSMSVAASPALSVSRNSIVFASGQSSDSFFIANSGTGTLTWSLSTNQNWLSASPSSGSTDTSPDRVVVSVNRSDLSPGTHTGEVRVTSNGGNATVAVTVSIDAVPALGTSVESLDFGSTNDLIQFTIRNTGSGVLTWSLSSDQPWLIVLPTLGATTDSDVVTATVVRLGLSSGDYSANISITSNGGSKTIPVAMRVPAPPQLNISTSSMDFGAEDTMQTFTIDNLGDGTLTWSITTADSWLTTRPETGQTGSGTDNVEVRVRRRDLSPGSYSSTVTVSSNGGNAIINVIMTVIEGIGGN